MGFVLDGSATSRLHLRQNLGERLRMVRRAHNPKITMEAAAMVAGITKQSICNIEKGTHFPRLDILLLLSQFYDVSVNELLGLEDMSIIPPPLKFYEPEVESKESPLDKFQPSTIEHLVTIGVQLDGLTETEAKMMTKSISIMLKQVRNHPRREALVRQLANVFCHLSSFITRISETKCLMACHKKLNKGAPYTYKDALRAMESYHDNPSLKLLYQALRELETNSRKWMNEEVQRMMAAD